MSHIRYAEPLNALVAVGGHGFDRNAFADMFEAMAGIAVSFIDHPAAAEMISPETLRNFDVLILYDMPGLDFFAQAPDRPAYVDPPNSYRANFRRLLEQGTGVVALHHAIAGWPSWPEYAEYLGGKFLYRSGPVRGTLRHDSGYRHDVTYDAVCVALEHPILSGLPLRFSLTDELYLFEVFEDDVFPLLRADSPFRQEDFHSAELAVSHGRMFDNDGWAHEPGSRLIGWVKRAINSPLAYLQPGDGPGTYGNPDYRRLVENAIRWAASPGAKAWARTGRA